MTGVQRFLANDRNLVRDAVLTASGVRSATAVETLLVSRAGNGRVRLAGAYTGHDDALFDVEIAAGGGTPRASVPAFLGVGNGTLDVVAVDSGATQQAWTFTLADLGIDTETAGLDVREVRILAKTPGAAGNSLRVTVTPALTLAATAYSLLADWSAGTATQTGEQWNFGALPLTAGGALDEASPRVVFGADPTVYRLWRQYKDGAWQFGTSPALERDVAAGTKVLAVTGGYTVTVTDGTSTETYATGIVTFYDLLTALAASALVEVSGVVAADRKAGGQAAIDVPLRTTAWLRSASGVALEQLAVQPAAPTEALTVRCVNADVVGAEIWSVEGPVSGKLPNATTGTLYTAAPVHFLVPPITVAENDGVWSFKYAATSRTDEEGLPSVCVRPFRFGVNAKPKTVTFNYQRRPPAECKCTDMPTPRLDLSCLGLTGDSDMALDPAYQSRLQDLYEWRRDFIRAQIDTANLLGVKIADGDMDYCDAAVSILATALGETYGTTAASDEWDLALTELQADFAALDSVKTVDKISASTRPGAIGLNPINGHVYRVDSVTTTVAPTAPDNLSFGMPPSYADPIWTTDGSAFEYVFDSGSAGVFTANITDMGALADIASVSGGGISTTTTRPTQTTIDNLVRRYSARMDYVRTLAGIVPKPEASTAAGGGCWRDYGDDFWWADVDGYYLPAFTNQPYISARRNTETQETYSTMEFGFGLVVACPDRLKEGDQLIIRIEQVDTDRPYQVGDTATLETIAAGPAYLTGGVDGTDELTWRVSGSVSGALPDYVVALAGAADYTQAGLTVNIAPGGIPFELGDVFSLATEAGQFRWRKDAGAWSAAADIPASGTLAIVDGLSVEFTPGAAPSFVAGDLYGYRALQPYSPANLRRPTEAGWSWAGVSATLVVDFGSVQPVDALAMARYSLPAGSTVTAEFSDDALTWSASLALPIAGPVSVTMLADVTARYLRLAVTNAPGGRIGWLWAGVPFATTYSAATCTPARRWARAQGSGINPATLPLGRGTGWSIEWNPQDLFHLTNADADALMDMADYLAEHDEPLIVVPHYLHPSDASLVALDAESLDFPDRYEYQPNDDGGRMLSAALAFDAVVA